LTLIPELTQQQSTEENMLRGKEMTMEQYWHKDLHRRKEGVKSKIQVALVGRQKLNEMTKKLIRTE